MGNYKYKVKSVEHGRAIQEKLFAQGYKWQGGSTEVEDLAPGWNIFSYQGRDGKRLTKEDGIKYFDRHPNVEQFVDEPKPKFKNQRILIGDNNPEVIKKVQEALFKQGYGWGLKKAKELDNINAGALYTDSEGYIRWSDASYFGSSENDDCEVVTVESLVPPEPVAETLEEQSRGKVISLNQFMDKVATLYPEKPPVGLRPRVEAERARGQEILEAMLRYVDAGKPVPYEWWSELEDVLNIEE